MIEPALKTAMQKIFDFKKTTFDADSGSHEQDCLFIEIDQILSNVRDNILQAKVMGKCTVYGQFDRMPASYLTQRIKAASNDLTKDLFFYDLEQATPVDVNIVKRTFSYVYFFVSQYDPHNDNIQSIEINEVIT